MWKRCHEVHFVPLKYSLLMLCHLAEARGCLRRIYLVTSTASTVQEAQYAFLFSFSWVNTWHKLLYIFRGLVLQIGGFVDNSRYGETSQPFIQMHQISLTELSYIKCGSLKIHILYYKRKEIGLHLNIISSYFRSIQRCNLPVLMPFICIPWIIFCVGTNRTLTFCFNTCWCSFFYRLWCS